MNLDEAIAAYLLPYDGQTYAQYKKALHAWLRWCDLNDIDPMRVTRTHIEAYSRWLGRQHTIATVRDIAGAVCRFYAFLADELVLDHNPAAAVRLPRKYRHSPAVSSHGNRRTDFCPPHGRPEHRNTRCALFCCSPGHVSARYSNSTSTIGTTPPAQSIISAKAISVRPCVSARSWPRHFARTSERDSMGLCSAHLPADGCAVTMLATSCT